ncbi:Hypothetical predicted protein [Lecanosticta acicola]|uniref:Thioesterase domain-containing protein n=1 Tax=Lecanosticta acicola TaxID=111012 RepID=A0AAI8YV10_9PEZI|nr:Hypothetical predicted protein [Lecanosticta acicola]
MAAHEVDTPEHEHIKKLTEDKTQTGIYAFTLADVRVTGASRGHVIARLPLSENHMNSQRSLHGAVSGAIVDWMGGMAIATHDLRSGTGVSIDIHVTYQSGAKIGDELEIEGIAEKVGGSLAFTKVNIFKVEDGKRGRVVSTGTHTKFVKGTESKKT